MNDAEFERATDFALQHILDRLPEFTGGAPDTAIFVTLFEDAKTMSRAQLRTLLQELGTSDAGVAEKYLRQLEGLPPRMIPVVFVSPCRLHIQWSEVLPFTAPAEKRAVPS